MHKGLKVCIVFEGRDGAGKGGTIKAITERVSPRVFRVVALPAPTEREKSQMYVQRYLPHLPGGRRSRDLRSQLVQPRRRRARDGLLLRRAGVKRSCKMVPPVEKAIVESGIILLKYWLEVSAEEQTRRLESRIDDGRKIWKLSPMDLKSYSRWYDYSRARDDMFAATDTASRPGTWRAPTTSGAPGSTSSRTCSSRFPTRRCRARRSSCPKRQKRGGYREPNYPYKYVKEVF